MPFRNVIWKKTQCFLPSFWLFLQFLCFSLILIVLESRPYLYFFLSLIIAMGEATRMRAEVEVNIVQGMWKKPLTLAMNMPRNDTAEQ